MKRLSLVTAILTFMTLVHGQTFVDMNLKFKAQIPTVYKLTTTTNDSISIILKGTSATVDYIAIKPVLNGRFRIALTNVDEKDILNNRKFNAVIDNKGNNLSFYLGDYASQLTRLLFGMPAAKITVGDSWKIGVDLTSFRGFVICDSSFKRDAVKVVDISISNTDTIVTVQYDFEEYFEGQFMNITSSRIKYTGKAAFSIKNGQWLSYECKKEMLMNTSGKFKNEDFKKSNKEPYVQTYKLELINDYPKKILDQLNMK